MFHTENAVNHHSHEINTFQHGLEFIMPSYTRITHSRPWWNVYLFAHWTMQT